MTFESICETSSGLSASPRRRLVNACNISIYNIRYKESLFTSCTLHKRFIMSGQKLLHSGFRVTHIYNLIKEKACLMSHAIIESRTEALTRKHFLPRSGPPDAHMTWSAFLQIRCQATRLKVLNPCLPRGGS